ncbi:ribonuclease domain-containing protein [Williamsia sp. CHRR-6]|uniref:ribonuclease domain-containing protein n=1 Tax=Williamsia sp. CHRR-6 TaxID=2835871 RepID=UPI001BDABD92|nr:ribonuclease domain-containing protein [Williamsia sp. CHRR-6]MBT0567704.1 ribonuclease [Williamsia sp. CHRR-6]
MLTTHSSRRPVRRTRTVGLAAALLAAASVAMLTPASANAAIGTCYLSNLPAQATDTVDLIHQGGPFPYPRNDGVVFSNFEGVLPKASSGYYHEYTVITPGASTRGARRVVTGGIPLTNPPHFYYTGDHYSTFCEIVDA